MSFMESLSVSAFGIAVVFVVLVGLSLLLRLQTALTSSFLGRKKAASEKIVMAKPVTAPVAEAEPISEAETEPESIPEPIAAPKTEYTVVVNGRTYEVAQEIGGDVAVASAPPVAKEAAAADAEASDTPSDLISRDYKVTLNGRAYEVTQAEQGFAVKRADTAPAESAPASKPAAPIKPAPAQAAPQPSAPESAPAAPASAQDGEPIEAPVAGVILDVRTSVGASVKQGEVLVLLEAMKMENEIVAPRDGTISQVLVEKGASVGTGTPLVVLQ